MTIREWAKKHEFEIKGKLTFWGLVNGEKVYIDEEGNEFTVMKYGPGAGDILCVDKDGGVW